MQSTYRAGIIGLGFIGAGDQVSGDRLGQQVTDLDGNHCQALSNHSRVQLVAGSTRDEGRRDRFGKRTGARTYSDWQQMLSAEKLDIVSVASYAPSHAELVEGCAKAGVRVIFCEKPIATTLADAERMVAVCRDAGSLLVINHNRRFHPHFREMARRVAAGELGDLTGGWLTWATGRLGNVGTHLIDAVMMLTGRTVQSVSAKLDLSGRPDCRGPEFRDPGGFAMLQLDGGLIVHVHAPDYSNSPAGIILHGTGGQLRIGGGAAVIGGWSSDPYPLPPKRPEDGTSMDRAVSEIVAWLDDGTPLTCQPESSVKTLEVILACHASHARNGAWVDLPLTGEDRDREVHTG